MKASHLCCLVVLLVGTVISTVVHPATSTSGEISRLSNAPHQLKEYGSQVESFLNLIGSGDIEQIMQLIENQGNKQKPELRTKVQHALAIIKTAGGDYDGREIVAVRQISPRIHYVYALMHYEKTFILVTLRLRKISDKWRIGYMNMTSKMDQLIEEVPLTRFVSDQTRR